MRKVNGVGRVFERELDAIGIKTCGDIYEHRAMLARLFGEKGMLRSLPFVCVISAFIFILFGVMGIMIVTKTSNSWRLSSVFSGPVIRHHDRQVLGNLGLSLRK